MVSVHYAAPVAQWIEHRSSKAMAVGSNPAGRASIHSLMPFFLHWHFSPIMNVDGVKLFILMVACSTGERLF